MMGSGVIFGNDDAIATFGFCPVEGSVHRPQYFFDRFAVLWISGNTQRDGYKAKRLAAVLYFEMPAGFTQLLSTLTGIVQG
jgi:hypothetical protein